MMNKWFYFLGGLVVGVVLTFFFLWLTSGSSGTEATTAKLSDNETAKEKIDGIRFFDEPGDLIDEKSVEVFQVIADDAALAKGKMKGNLASDFYLGQIYLIINNTGHYYYDGEIIKPDKGHVMRQIGVFQYPTKNDIVKTVPVIAVMEE